MFGFGKKKEQSPAVAPLSAPKPLNDEIELIPEDIPEIPSELPPLEIKQKVAVPEKVEMPEPKMVVPISTVLKTGSAMRTIQEKAESVESQKYIRTDTQVAILSSINEINSDFDSMNMEVERVIELKNARYQKIDAMQSTLEDIGKKLMDIDQIAFGG